MRSLTLLAAVASIGLFSATPSHAFIACSISHDCWQTDSKLKWPGATVMYHDDSWRDEHKNDESYHFHDADPQHDSHRGYWADGEWHTG
jgi:hypothetical protein